MFKRKVTKETIVQKPTKRAINELMDTGSVFAMQGNERTAMTLSCRDADYIPKVKDAGLVKNYKGKKVQVMHNGLLVIDGGYHGDWMSKIIQTLKGHHEPQEEKAFYEILKKLPNNPVMIELGSFWAYYSLWLRHEKPKAINICCEPDSTNMKIGKANAKLNNIEDIIFIEAASGINDHEEIEFHLDSDPTQIKQVQIRTVDGLVEDNKIQSLDLLHMDIQGHELDALQGALKTIKSKKLRFLIVSTHHYFFSNDPLTHQKCKEFIISNGGHIIASHTVLESFSGDGLIVASFDKQDKNFSIDLSLNHTDNSLFRSYEKDLAILIEKYNEIVGA